jgi:fermentation-respiration switch protein FrsA (DUF1100 family)
MREPARKPKFLRRIAIVIAILFVAGVGFAWFVGEQLIAARLVSMPPPPPALHAEAVNFPSASGSTIHGWYSAGERGSGAVLLLHGVRANRMSMVSRASFLNRLGYSVLLVDLQAHGESPGRNITFGDLESADATAAVDFLRRKAPGERVGAIGTSLGAASLVLATKRAALDAVVLESLYPTIEDAVENRLTLHLGSMGRVAAPFLLKQMELQLGVEAKRLRPIAHVADLGAPLLLIHGTLDRHTHLEEARRLFSAAREPKALWEVEGAAHVDLHRFAGKRYEMRVSRWLSQYLRGPAASE